MLFSFFFFFFFFFNTRDKTILNYANMETWGGIFLVMFVSLLKFVIQHKTPGVNSGALWLHHIQFHNLAFRTARAQTFVKFFNIAGRSAHAAQASLAACEPKPSSPTCNVVARSRRLAARLRLAQPSNHLPTGILVLRLLNSLELKHGHCQKTKQKPFLSFPVSV
jgi:hypothetical protein